MLSRLLSQHSRRAPAALLAVCLSWACISVAAAEVDVEVLHHFSPEPLRSGGGLRPRAGVVQSPGGVFYGTTLQGGQYGKGAIYRSLPDGRTRIVHSFGGDDGANPNSELVVGDDGALYGSTRGFGYGNRKRHESVLFKYDATAGFTLLHTFDWDTEGGLPGTLLRARDGNFYGTLERSAEDGHGALFRMTPGGQVTILHRFKSSGMSEPTGILTQGPDGALYGTSRIYYRRSAGPVVLNWGAVYRYGIASGKVAVLHAFPTSSESPEGTQPDSGLVLGRDGALYGMTSAGGATGNGTFFKLNTDGSGFAVLSSLPYQRLAFSTNQLILGRDGNFYGSDLPELLRAGQLIRLTPDGVHTVLYEFPSEGEMAMGSAPEGRLLQDSQGRLVGTAQHGGNAASGTLFRTVGPVDSGAR